MPDLERVIKGLECCKIPFRKCYNGGCPYFKNDGCKARLKGDALELLKAQEPRLVTESDFDGADEYGYLPVWTEEKDGDMYFECIPKIAITDPDGIAVFRFWTSRPTDDRREAVK